MPHSIAAAFACAYGELTNGTPNLVGYSGLSGAAGLQFDVTALENSHPAAACTFIGAVITAANAAQLCKNFSGRVGWAEFVQVCTRIGYVGLVARKTIYHRVRQSGAA